jgi:hypothetical protein
MGTESTTEQCGEMASLRYTWPGRDETVICVDCAEKLAGVANAIGMHLQLLPITSSDVPDALDWPTCPQVKGS